MNDGHRTSTISRPKARESAEPTQAERNRPARTRHTPRSAPAGDQRPTLIQDLTTPIERGKQLVPQRRGRLVVALFSTVIALAIGAALFVLPIKSWLQQRDDLATRTGELDTLDAANDRLQVEVDRLQTDAGIKEAAREEIDYVEEGEQRITTLPVAAAPTALPPGWPYDLISQIVSLRQAEAAQAAAAPATETTPAP